MPVRKHNLILILCLLISIASFILPVEGSFALVENLKSKHVVQSAWPVGHSTETAMYPVFAFLFYLLLFFSVILLISALAFWTETKRQQLFIRLLFICSLISALFLVVQSLFPLVYHHVVVDGKLILNGYYRVPLTLYTYCYFVLPLLSLLALRYNKAFQATELVDTL